MKCVIKGLLNRRNKFFYDLCSFSFWYSDCCCAAAAVTADGGRCRRFLFSFFSIKMSMIFFLFILFFVCRCLFRNTRGPSRCSLVTWPDTLCPDKMYLCVKYWLVIISNATLMIQTEFLSFPHSHATNSTAALSFYFFLLQSSVLKRLWISIQCFFFSRSILW